MPKKVYQKMKKHLTNGKKLLQKTAFYWAIKKIIFGKWVTQAPADPAQKYMWIAEPMKKEKLWMEVHW